LELKKTPNRKANLADRDMTKEDLQANWHKFSYVCKLKVQVLNIHFELETRYGSITIYSFNLESKKALNPKANSADPGSFFG
jgi:hypothetical protein